MKYDIAIIGSGILGTTLSYWLSTLTSLRICVFDKEHCEAQHASSRNTGVVHSPFYINPQKKTIAKSTLLSHDLWKLLALKNNIPWMKVGTIEVAINEKQHNTLEKYLNWGVENGLDETELYLFDHNQISTKEPHVKCYSGIYCTRDVSTDYGMLTNVMKNYSEKNMTDFFFNFEIKNIINYPDHTKLIFKNGREIIANFVINCAGGYSLDLAHKFNLANEYSTINFRGDYIIASTHHGNLVNTNIYSVPEFEEYPFLDPHWIKKSNGNTEIGPTALPVMTPETYDGWINNFRDIFYLFKHIKANTLKIIFNSDFLTLASKEFLSSISKTYMINRIKKFIPDVDPKYFVTKGTSGIRSQIILNDGTFMNDVLELYDHNSLHIINHNSPGATGAPVYSASIVTKLHEKGFIKIKKNYTNIWDYDKILNASN